MAGWDSALKSVKTSEPVVQVQPLILHKLDKKNIFTLDFETYYSDDYTIRKLSTSEYVRDPRFKPHMLGIKRGDGKTKVIPGPKIAEALAALNLQNKAILCHNTAFDGFILSHHYGIIPAFYYDTLSMARGLHKNDIGASLDEVAQFYGAGAKVAGVLDRAKNVLDLGKEQYAEMAVYCASDVDLTWDIFLQMIQQFPDTEIELVHETIRMFTNPVLMVDIPRAQKALELELQNRRELILRVGATNDYEQSKNSLSSNDRFAALLRAEGIDPPTKISPAWKKKPKSERDDSKKYAYAFSKSDLEFLALKKHRSKRVRELVEARLSVKSTLSVTRPQRLITAGSNGDKLPIMLNYYGAHTGRWSGGNKMNAQNFQRGSELRKSIIAPPGYVIGVVDSGQIEARMNGWLWGQADLLENFRIQDAYEQEQSALPKDQRTLATGKNRDVYCKFADDIYNMEVTKKNPNERFVGKVSVLGLGYQMGGPKLQLTLALGAMGPPVDIELDQAYSIVQAYRRRNYKIVEGWGRATVIIEQMAAGTTGSWGPISWEKDRLWLPNGMALKYPGLHLRRGKLRIEDDPDDEDSLADQEDTRTQWVYQRKGKEAKIYGGLLTENIVQALARIVVSDQLLLIRNRVRPVMFTHDEVAALLPKERAAIEHAYMMECMLAPPSWAPDLPLSVEGGWDDCYSK